MNTHIYTDLIKPFEQSDNIHTASDIMLKNDKIIEFNSKQIHNINNVIIMIYIYIRDILLNPMFIDEVKKTLRNESEFSQLKFMFDNDELSKLLLINESDNQINILGYFVRLKLIDLFAWLRRCSGVSLI